ncbi:unnamed protein product [Didymodactylos carnosus]|uniref:Uncharacterized protein n=1 Tax=Didymodactylos carnosus TaxID=1234261 RepID=A0A815IHC8_9BILA|nr:unnamed protein product [Didymodactylos carnosus]CAF4253280.1 unnamed protein product [Didymodactylos carnosus]
MHWNNGLHQFLQIKHGAKISAESLTTNFISNVTYFKRYGLNIYGLTGTLGSIKAQELLNNTYNVDCVTIPPFRQKQYIELTAIITNNEDDWYTQIVESSINKLINGRGVLVITKYIKEVDEIKNRLITFGYDRSKIKIYRTETDSKIIEEELKPGEIIIATNIAGRGTDIRAEKIEINGGLHVCVTFLPPNERVEQQNVGRTSRTGNKGTGQFILFEKRENNFNELKEIGNMQEENGIAKAKKEIERVTIKDCIFAEFCKLLDEIDNGTDDEKNNAHIKIKIRAVEDRFGIWLKIEEINMIEKTKQEILDEFEKFKQQILDDKKQNKLIKNPYFYVLTGNKLLNEKKHKQAIDEYTKAIEMDKNFQANAYYNRGYAKLAEYGCNTKKYKQEIDGAINDFKQAKEIIEEFELMLNIIQKASDSEALSEQVRHKLALFGTQKNTIDMAIGTGSINKEIEELENYKKRKDIPAETKETIDKQIKMIKEIKEIGIIGKAKKLERNLEIEFLDIEKSLPEDEDFKLYKDEIQEYKNNGFRGNFKIKEIKPIDWSSVVGVALLGIAQIVAGGALAVFTLGAGSSFAMDLISEGVGDLIIAVKDGIINRDFSWASYGIQKAISLTVSIVCAGLGAIKDAAKTAVAGVKQAATIVTGTAKTVVTTTVKAGWKLAAKAMGTSLAKGVAKELVTQLVDYGVNKALMPCIEEEVMKRIEVPIQNALIANPIVEKM